MMPIHWTPAGPRILAAFLASFVEGVEALTVVLAVGSVRGWKNALAGVVAALLVLLALVGVLGSMLQKIPLARLQMVIGALLLLFGLRWLRKAVLRASGHITLHDESAAFAKNTAALQAGKSAGTWDPLAIGTAFQITMLEGVEVVFIVIAVGAGGRGLLLSASLGAVAALLAVVALGIALRRPLAQVPENTLKFAVGVLLSAFGTFWAGEGMGIDWPGADAALPVLVAAYTAAALLGVTLCRRGPARHRAPRGAAL